MGGPIYIGTTEINEVGELKLGGSNVLAAYVGDVKVFPLTTTTTTTTTTTEAPVTTTTTTSTTTTTTTIPVYSYCTGYDATNCCVAITDFTNNCYL